MDDEAWSRVLAAFEDDAGEAPSQELEAWELCSLARLAAKELSLKGKAAKQVEQLLLGRCEGMALEACREALAERFSASDEAGAKCVAEAEALVAACIEEVEQFVRSSPSSPTRRTRSRSRGRDALSKAKSALQGALSSRRPYSKATTSAAAALLRAGQRLEKELSPADAKAQAGTASRCLAAPSCLGPPAFFPVGNAAGRFAPLSRGLDVPEPQLLFIGLSDPRHLFAALQELPSAVRVRRCAVNDLNAETCARNALLVALLGAEGPRVERLLAAFALWWTHELPVAALPLLARTASALAESGSCCGDTAAVLRSWVAAWTSPGAPTQSEDLTEIFGVADLSPGALADAACSILQGGIVVNETLRHPTARLDYGLYRERRPPEGWEAAGDGLLLWPEVPPEREFDTDHGQPPRSEYLAALAWNLPRFLGAAGQIASDWIEAKRVACEFLAGDCLALPARLTGGFDRIFTSNVADHVGLPALALTLGGLLGRSGQLRVSLSNNLRALDSHGDVLSLIPKVHGISAEALAAACGLRSVARGEGEAEADQLCLAAEPPEAGAAEALQAWPAECARRLYRCPPADPETVARRRAQGEPMGMAYRYARRFTVSPATVACIARLLERAAQTLPVDLAVNVAKQAKDGLRHSQLRLAQCFDWSALPGAVRAALAPEVEPTPQRRLALEVPRGSIPDWAWRAHPPVVLLWVRASGFAAAQAAGVDLAPREPVWGRCRNRRQMSFLEAGVWGPLRWAVEASSEDVQVLDGLEISLQASGGFRVAFALPEVEAEYAVGAAAFLLSLVDNAIVSGPHRAGDLKSAE